jgi:hypothetical protein
LESSCQDALKFCEPFLRKDLVIVFDEWPFGEDKVWTEFAEKRNIKWEKIRAVEYQQVIKVI